MISHIRYESRDSEQGRDMWLNSRRDVITQTLPDFSFAVAKPRLKFDD